MTHQMHTYNIMIYICIIMLYVCIMATVTNTLKVLRAQHNLTQDELATKVGVTRTTITYLEKNQYMPSLALAVKLSRYFNQPIESIFLVSFEDES
jgi:putative transcriptional regulator